MANSRTAGHAIRRRQGDKSSHLDSIGIGGRVNIATPEEALAGMARIGSPRVPMGTSVIDNIKRIGAVPVLRGELRLKGGAQAGDPTPPTAHRNNVSQESLGAAHRIKVSTPPMTSPEAGPTLANGKVIPSSVPRGDSFGDGLGGSYAGY